MLLFFLLCKKWALRFTTEVHDVTVESPKGEGGGTSENVSERSARYE